MWDSLSSESSALRCSGNALGAQGVVALAEALGAVCQLRALTLRDNRCEDTGAGAIAEALGRNRSLKELDLAGNEIHDGGGQSLGLALASSPGPRLTFLGLKSNRIGGDLRLDVHYNLILDSTI
eukprot:s831_g9.t1